MNLWACFGKRRSSLTAVAILQLPCFILRSVMYWAIPNVKFYTGSLTDWLKDERDLPLHTYQNEHLLRDPLWVQWWAGKRDPISGKRSESSNGRCQDPRKNTMRVISPMP